MFQATPTISVAIHLAVFMNKPLLTLSTVSLAASIFVSSFETGGIAGSVVAGYAADKLVAMVG